MIFSSPDPTTQALDYILDDSHIEWFPCGSRFFGDADKDSDFDFFTSDPAAEGELEISGFKQIEKHRGYLDKNTLATWQKGQVHAIIVKSSTARIDAQELIRPLSKKKRRTRDAWDNAYAKVAPELCK